MYNEWTKPREYSFMNGAGEVFHEIAYSRQDVNAFAKMHNAVRYRPTPQSNEQAIGDEFTWQTTTASRQIT
jgi:hypothetical protein